MGEVATQGRTVLFVSHNMDAVRRLCSSAFLLTSGRIVQTGSSADIIAQYLDTSENKSKRLIDVPHRQGKGRILFEDIKFYTPGYASLVTGRRGVIEITFGGTVFDRPRKSRIGILILNRFGEMMFNFATDLWPDDFYLNGGSKVVCEIPRVPLEGGEYIANLFLDCEGVVEDWLQNVVGLEVQDDSFFGTHRNSPPGWQGRWVLVDHGWRVLETAEPAPADAVR
jgi:lipopolysaccharide transport system ATP-binding protein